MAGRSRLRVLICGHSMIFWAAHRAKRSAAGSQLGLSRMATVEWRGRRGLRWPGLFPLLFREGTAPPHVLLVHLGGNDLGLMKGKALVIQAVHDLHYIQAEWPGVLIVWSAMLPRLVWRGEGDPRCLDLARRKANRELKKALQAGLGVFLPHPGIQVTSRDLYRDDGVHLSDKGNDLFLQDLRQGLLTAIGGWWGARA